MYAQSLAVAAAVVISIFSTALLGVFVWAVEVRARWKAGAVLAYAAAVALLLAGGSSLHFVAGLALQTLLTLSLSLYFRVEF